MKERIITAVVLAIVLLPLAVEPVSASPVITVIFGLLAAIGTGEMLNCFQLLEKWMISVPLIVAAAIAPYFARYLGRRDFVLYFAAVMFVLFFYTMTLAIWSKGRIRPEQSAACMMMVIYIISGLCSAVFLRMLPDGYYLFFLIFIGAWVTDIFAYFCGMLFGKHKLIEDVSPKKTVEGAVGGVVFTAAAYLIFGLIFARADGFSVPLWSFPVLGVAASLVSQLGDLLMSLFKRQYGIKDYGKLFPGHGGVLDRFDSVISVAPFLYLLCCVLH